MYQFKVRALLVALMALALLGCEQKQAAPENSESDTAVVSETERLNAWLEQQYEEELMQSPLALTFQGRKERYGEIDDLSESAEDEALEWKLDSVKRMQEQFDYDALDDVAKLSYDLWAYQGKQAQLNHKWRRHEYIFHQMDGWHGYLPTVLMSFHKVESESDFEAYISRITEIGRAVNQLTERAKLAAADGIRPPRFAYDIVMEQANELIEGAPFNAADQDSPVWTDAKTKAGALVEAGTLTNEQADKLLAKAKENLVNSFGPAYKGVVGFLKDDYDNTSEEAQGMHALPNGAQAYNDMLWLNTTTSMTADEIHDLGLAEVKRIRGEMEILKDKAGFEGSLQEFFAFLRTSKDDERFYYPNTDEGRQAYIDDATAAIDNIEKALPEYFGIMPKADLVVRRVESFREQDGAPQHYFPSTPDGSRPGVYYAHLSDMSAMPKRELEVIAYHEGLPGHHMQIAIQQELEGIPTFRTQAGFTSYVEGWALYSEILATEVPDTYQDVYSDFGRLGSEMWRAIRLVVDTGMHHKGWSQQQAVDFFSANSAAPLPQVEAEVRRYLVIPGQATSYKVGMIDIQRLRKLAEEELGNDFDIRKFHDVVLDGGALPLEMLDRKVRAYIQADKAVVAD